MRFAYAMKPLVCALVVATAAACTLAKNSDKGPTGDETRAAAPRTVCDGTIPGQAVVRLLGTGAITVKSRWLDLHEEVPFFDCRVHAGDSFADPRVRIALMSLDEFEDDGKVEDYNLSSFTDRPVKSIETELGKARIAPRRGLFLPVCNGRPYVTLVIPPSDEGPDRYKAVRAIGVAVEKALDEAQDCKENDDGGGGGNATRSEG